MTESIGINLAKGCVKCGAADHFLYAQSFVPDEGPEVLDLVLECATCEYKTNSFPIVANFTEVE